MKKDVIKSKHNSKTNRKSFFKIPLASIFILFFVLTLLPGCRLLFFSRTAVIENIATAKSSKIWEEPVSSPNINIEQFVAGSAGCSAGFQAGSSILSESSICSAALYSFYDNLAEQLKLFKNKSAQSELTTEKVTAKADETVTQPQDSAEQTTNQESSSEEQQQQQQNQAQAEQPASTQDNQGGGFELALLSLINNARNSNCLPDLSLNSTLNSIAKNRSDGMIARDYFSHITPDGKDIKSIFAENGIMYKTIGENLQYCSPLSMAGAELFFNTWMESEMHRANILGSGYTQIGIALSSSADKSIAVLVFLG